MSLKKRDNIVFEKTQNLYNSPASTWYVVITMPAMYEVATWRVQLFNVLPGLLIMPASPLLSAWS